MQRHSVATLIGAQLDYWVAKAVGMNKPIIVAEKDKPAECLVEVDGTAFEPFSPTGAEGVVDTLLAASPVRLMRVGTPIGPAWAALTPEGLRFVSTSWTFAALRALVGMKYGAFVFDEAEE